MSENDICSNIMERRRRYIENQIADLGEPAIVQKFGQFGEHKHGYWKVSPDCILRLTWYEGAKNWDWNSQIVFTDSEIAILSSLMEE